MAGYPFGVDDAKLSAINNSGALAATKVDIEAILSISLTTESDTTEARGDNQLKKTRRTGKRATGDVEMQATTLPVIAVVGDGAVVSSGTTPEVVQTYTEPATTTGKRFQIEAQAADDDGTATRMTILNATATAGPDFEWSESEFSAPSFSYEGNAKAGNLYTIAEYETEEPISTTNP